MEQQFIHYVCLLSMNPGKNLTEELIRGHVRYLRNLDQQGKLVVCGPFRDYKGGMVVFRADSYEEAQRIVESDPFITSGVESYELRTMEVSCEENNHMGMG